MNNTTDKDYDDEFPVFSLHVYLAYGTVGGIITILTIFGNTLTVLSYIRDAKLHSVYNTYIFNLAIADLILGAIVLPVYLVYMLWPGSLWLGYYLCKAFYIIDFTVCVEGVFMMIIISYDRLMLLRCGVSYNHLETQTKCKVLIGLSWTLSFFIYSPAIMFWDIWYDTKDVNMPGLCEVQFAHHFAFTTTTAFLEFFIPLVLLVVVNFCIIVEMRKRMKFRLSGIFRRSFRRSKQSDTSSTKSSLISTVTDSTRSNSSSAEIKSKKGQKELIKQREKRAIKSLCILMSVFSLTWAPYTIYTMIKAMRKGDIEILSYEALTWNLWLKSAVNPILYAYNSKRYKSNFKYFLCCCRQQRFKSK